MDKSSQEIFNQILNLDPESMSQDQKDFILARRSYLNDVDRKRYAGLIEDHEKSLKKGAPAEKAK